MIYNWFSFRVSPLHWSKRKNLIVCKYQIKCDVNNNNYNKEEKSKIN